MVSSGPSQQFFSKTFCLTYQITNQGHSI